MERCEARIGSGYHRPVCGNTAKMEYNGQHYCGVHDPVKAAERRAVNNAKWKAEMDAQSAARAAAKQRQAAQDALVEAVLKAHNDRRFLDAHATWSAIVDLARAAKGDAAAAVDTLDIPAFLRRGED